MSKHQAAHVGLTNKTELSLSGNAQNVVRKAAMYVEMHQPVITAAVLKKIGQQR